MGGTRSRGDQLQVWSARQLLLVQSLFSMQGVPAPCLVQRLFEQEPLMHSLPRLHGWPAADLHTPLAPTALQSWPTGQMAPVPQTQLPLLPVQWRARPFVHWPSLSQVQVPLEHVLPRSAPVQSPLPVHATQALEVHFVAVSEQYRPELHSTHLLVVVSHAGLPATPAQSSSLLQPQLLETHAWPLLLLAQLVPHPPQLAGSLAVLASQPFAPIPSQFWKPALHEATAQVLDEHA